MDASGLTAAGRIGVEAKVSSVHPTNNGKGIVTYGEIGVIGADTGI